jgi:signal transduction histidine kinase
MNFDIITNNEICHILISQAPLELISYSHIPTALFSLIASIFIFIKSGRILVTRLLLIISSLFALWSALDLAVWTSYNPHYTMLAWMPLGALFALIYAFSLYFSYVFFDKDDISLRLKWLIFGPTLPVLLLTGTKWNIVGFNGFTCEAIEGKWFTNYYHLYGGVVVVLVLILAWMRYRSATSRFSKRKILLFGIGMELFLIAFFVAGFLASLLDNFMIGLYGLFGMPLLFAFLGYLIVSFRIFDVKLFGVQALVFTLVSLIGAQFFFVKTPIDFTLTVVTFFLVLVTGYFLIRSFKQSEERKDELQIIADRLAISNERLRELDSTKTEFISIASHQLRTPLTSIKGYCSLLLEGSYGKIDHAVEEILHRIVLSSDRLVNLVENLLSISRMESGRMEYAPEKQHIEKILSEIYDSFALAAAAKKLSFKISLREKPVHMLLLDKQKIQEVFSNLIDNALKYTNYGGVEVIVTEDRYEQKVRVVVKDTGIGIPAEEIPFLFVKFSRGKDTNRLHANGTGLGLYVAKNIIEAHKGTIHIESEGAGKGTSFIVEFSWGEIA